MFIIKLFNTEPVSPIFDTGAMCSCMLASLYDQISKKVAMTKKHLRVGQADGTSLGPKGLVRLLIEINEITLNICSLSVKISNNPYYLEWILPNVIKLELIEIIQEHYTYGIREEN